MNLFVFKRNLLELMFLFPRCSRCDVDSLTFCTKVRGNFSDNRDICIHELLQEPALSAI